MGKRLLTALALLVSWALVAEGTLQLASLVPGLEAVITGRGPALLVADERLGLRGNAEHPEHDEWGYRNAARPARAEVVALGDSQTWGTGVDRHQAWPAVLARRLGARVYSMANPSFGAAHHWLELERALSLEPRVVLLTIYLGNDLYDGFRLSGENAEVAAFAPEELLRVAQELERREPLSAMSEHLFAPAVAKRREINGIRRLLSEHSKAYNLASTLRRALTTSEQAHALSRDLDGTNRALTPEQRTFTSMHHDGDWQTILTSPYRRRVVDYRDPRIAVGLGTLRASIARIADRCRREGVRLVTVFIPTKEKVFASRVDRPEEHALLAQLVDDERSVKLTLIDDLNRRGVQHVDLLSALRDAPEQPYFEDLDGHPNAAGHETIARELGRHLLPTRDFVSGRGPEARVSRLAVQASAMSRPAEPAPQS